MILLHETDHGQVWHGDGTAAQVEADVIVTDPPYSGRTHEKSSPAGLFGTVTGSGGDCQRRELGYAAWTPADVARACDAWCPGTRGWICILTDYLLGRAWEAELERHGRYVFAPLPCYSPGSRVRLAGDGPSSWTVWLLVARPRTRTGWKRGTKPGGYIYRPEHMPLVGGKPVALMRAIVADYSEPGDLVVDPCCGAGSTLQAAEDLGRRWWGADINLDHARMAAGRMGASSDSGPLFEVQHVK